MSRTSHFLSGVTLGYVNQALIMLVGLWLTPFLLRHLGKHDLGLWLVGFQILAYLGLMDFGIVALVPRETAYATGRDPDVQLPLVAGQTMRVVLYQTPLVVVAAILAWLLLPAEWEAIRDPLALAMTAFVLLFPLRIFQGVLQGMQDLAFLGGLQILSWLAGTALTVVLVLEGFRLHALVAGWSFGQVLVAGISVARLRTVLPGFVPWRLPAMPARTLGSFLVRGFWVSVSQVARLLVAGADILIIGKLLGPSAVVLYTCTGKLATVLANQPQMLMQMAIPGLSQLRAGEDKARLYGATTALSQGMLTISGAVACVILAVNEGFVGWWVGSDLYGGFQLTALFVATMLLRHWNDTAVYSIFCFGYERRISITTFFDGALSVAAALALVPRIGPVGALIGSLLGVCLVSLPGNLSALCTAVAKSIPATVAPLWPWFWRFAAMSTIATAAGHFLTSPTLVRCVALSVGIGLLYVGIMLRTSLNSSLGTYAVPQLASLWRRVVGANGLPR
jgi:O-antigen/teichoic acid export membrane protein